jgi:isocitrate dehydrogenase kinase/phosphatase
MSSISFNLRPVDEKPSRRYKKGSKYDPILDAFMEGNSNLVQVTIEDKDANYLRTQLNKRIEARNLSNVEVSVVNNLAYLEKL